MDEPAEQEGPNQVAPELIAELLGMEESVAGDLGEIQTRLAKINQRLQGCRSMLHLQPSPKL